jgi:adenylate kinase family enzyme
MKSKYSFQKIMIIGCCGAGKSTLTRKLHDKTKLPLVHLDELYWQSGWVEPATREWEQAVIKTSNNEAWIMDGNYGGTMDI